MFLYVYTIETDSFYGERENFSHSFDRETKTLKARTYTQNKKKTIILTQVLFSYNLIMEVNENRWFFYSFFSCAR